MTEWYCPLPFKHAFVDSTGVAACCQTPRQQVSLAEWPTNQYLLQLQQQVLSGKIPTVCQGCVAQEKSQGVSLRTAALKDYNYRKFTKTEIDFIDYRSSNICNFKCRSCEPRFSHGIAVELQRNHELEKFYQPLQQKIVYVDNDNAEWVRENLPQIKRLMLTGGEPTYIPAVKLIVERVIYDQLDIDLMITTNASFVDDFWCEATRLHKKLHWTISLDAVGDAAKIVRYGSDWDVVTRNTKWLAQNSTSMDINTVISNLNLLQLYPLLKFVNQLQKDSIFPRGQHGKQGCRHQFHICQPNSYRSACNWPDHLRHPVMDHLRQCLTLELDPEQKNMVIGLLHQIQESKFDSHLWDRSEEFNNILDSARQQNHKILFENIQHI